jgi:hypothetical protein
VAGLDVVDWDGRRCGLQSHRSVVWEYEGLRALGALQVSPFETHPDKDDIKKELIACGRVFEKLRGQFFMAYTDEHEERLNERTMIDARTYHKFSIPNQFGSRDGFPYFANLAETGRLSWAQSMNRYSSTVEDEATMDVDLSPLTDEQCLLCVPTVKCFNIETKKWGKYLVQEFEKKFIRIGVLFPWTSTNVGYGKSGSEKAP